MNNTVTSLPTELVSELEAAFKITKVKLTPDSNGLLELETSINILCKHFDNAMDIVKKRVEAENKPFFDWFNKLQHEMPVPSGNKA